MIRDVLELEEINIERAHRVDNKSKKRNAPRTIVAKFPSYKDKLFSQLQKKKLYIYVLSMKTTQKKYWK